MDRDFIKSPYFRRWRAQARYRSGRRVVLGAFRAQCNARLFLREELQCRGDLYREVTLVDQLSERSVSFESLADLAAFATRPRKAPALAPSPSGGLSPGTGGRGGAAIPLLFSGGSGVHH